MTPHLSSGSWELSKELILKLSKEHYTNAQIIQQLHKGRPGFTPTYVLTMIILIADTRTSERQLGYQLQKWKKDGVQDTTTDEMYEFIASKANLH